MGNFTVAAIFLILANILMWLVQLAMVNVGGSFVCYHLEGSIIETPITNTDLSYNQSVFNNEVSNNLPTSQSSSVSAGGTSIAYTDVFGSFLNWAKGTPLRYLAVVAAPYNLLKCTGLATEIVIAIGTFWYLITFLFFISFLRGGSD